MRVEHENINIIKQGKRRKERIKKSFRGRNEELEEEKKKKKIIIV